VIRKERASAFFGTLLPTHLVNMGADTLIVSGCTTSGCVRATVIDGFSYGYKMFVVEECVFDRGQASHKVNLFDMNAKYATVLPLTRVLGYLKTLRPQN
jgi:nicotinamidase-related amidase